MQKEEQPESRFLYSLQGFQYFDLLLGHGKDREVQDRATQTLAWAEKFSFGLLSIALDHLIFGPCPFSRGAATGEG